MAAIIDTFLIHEIMKIKSIIVYAFYNLNLQHAYGFVLKTNEFKFFILSAVRNPGKRKPEMKTSNLFVDKFNT